LGTPICATYIDAARAQKVSPFKAVETILKNRPKKLFSNSAEKFSRKKVDAMFYQCR
jgi:hypothetical protein